MFISSLQKMGLLCLRLVTIAQLFRWITTETWGKIWELLKKRFSAYRPSGYIEFEPGLTKAEHEAKYRHVEWIFFWVDNHPSHIMHTNENPFLEDMLYHKV